MMTDTHALGAFLRNCRSRLDPQLFGFAASRRRTPGLRREEVAQLADVSTTWYTWLEQGRANSASSSTLERIATALRLNDVEREHLFLLAQNRPPAVRSSAPSPITPSLQRTLDAIAGVPAIIRNATWDVVAWNGAACAVLSDYEALAVGKRNVLDLLFTHPQCHLVFEDWEAYARRVVAAFRAETARRGVRDEVAAFVDDLAARSPEFAAMWRENAVHAHAEGTKALQTEMGRVALDYSSFSVHDRPDLVMCVFTPVAAIDAERVRQLIERRARARDRVAG